MTDTPLTIAGKSYASRLIIGAGKRKTWSQIVLAEGDQLEIVQFVGGG